MEDLEDIIVNRRTGFYHEVLISFAGGSILKPLNKITTYNKQEKMTNGRPSRKKQL
jgi:hypothetical protein